MILKLQKAKLKRYFIKKSEALLVLHLCNICEASQIVKVQLQRLNWTWAVIIFSQTLT